MKKRNSVFQTLVVLVVLFSMIFGSIGIARADGGAMIWLWLLGQVANDMRQQSVERHSIGFNPSANVLDPRGNFVGAIADLRDTVSAVGLGAIVKISSGATSTGVIVAHRLSCDEEDFPDIGVYREDLEKVAKNGKEVKENDFTKGIMKSMSATSNKFSLFVDTARLSHRMYSCKLTTYYIDSEPSGLLRLGRKSVIRFQETVFKILIRDSRYLARAMNDVAIQRELMMTAGLIGGLGQLAKPSYEIKSDVKDEVSRPYAPDGTLLPVVPNAPKVERTEKTEVTTTVGKPQVTPPTFEIMPKYSPQPSAKLELPTGTKDKETLRVTPTPCVSPAVTASPEPTKTEAPKEAVKVVETAKISNPSSADNGSTAVSTNNSAQIVVSNTASGDNSNAQVMITNSTNNQPVVIEHKMCQKKGTVRITFGTIKGCVYVWETSPNGEETQTKMLLDGMNLSWRDSSGKTGCLIYRDLSQRGVIQFKCEIGTKIQVRLDGTSYWTSPSIVGEDIVDGNGRVIMPSLQYNFKTGGGR